MKNKTKKIQGYIIVTEEDGIPIDYQEGMMLAYHKKKIALEDAKEINSFPRNTSKVKVQKAEIIIK